MTSPNQPHRPDQTARENSGPSPRENSGPSPRENGGPSPRENSGPSPRAPAPGGTIFFSKNPTYLCSAILARLWLKESVTRTDAVLYCCIVGGVSLTAACLPRETEILKIHESSLLYGDASAVACWVVMGLALAFLHYLILVRFERQYDDPVHHYAKQPKRIYRIAMFSYPFILGVAIVQLRL